MTALHLHLQDTCNNLAVMIARTTEESSSLDDIRRTLRAAGLRVTASRVAVLRLLATATRPLTHQDVVDALVDNPWNRSTLYRNLIDLADTDIARRTVFGGLARFELMGRANSCTEHPHFVCTECGEVSHLEGVRVRIEGQELPDSVSKGEYEVQLRGRCDGCR